MSGRFYAEMQATNPHCKKCVTAQKCRIPSGGGLKCVDPWGQINESRYKCIFLVPKKKNWKIPRESSGVRYCECVLYKPRTKFVETTFLWVVTATRTCVDIFCGNY